MSNIEEIIAMDGPLPANLANQWQHFFGKSWKPADVFECDLHPLQRMRELEKMVQLAGTVNPLVVMEIGADKGGSLLWWCSISPVRRVIACEIRGTPYQHEFEITFPNVDFLWLPQNSYALSTLHKVQEWLDGDFIDCLFIDGDKSRFAEDFLCYQSMMREGGLAFFHDIQDEAPRLGYDHILRVYPERRHQEIIDTTEVEGSFQRSPHPLNGYDAWLRHWQGRSCGVGIVQL